MGDQRPTHVVSAFHRRDLDGDDFAGSELVLVSLSRTYTIEQFDGTLTNRITAPGDYVVKLVTVRVRPTLGPFPGLRTTTQSLYLRLRNA